MDDFTVYGDSFEEALENLEKVLIRCKETNLSLSHEKCFMMFTEGIVLGHHFSKGSMSTCGCNGISFERVGLPALWQLLHLLTYCFASLKREGQ